MVDNPSSLIPGEVIDPSSLRNALPGDEVAADVVRVQVPRDMKKGQSVPLVLALHGAGGSENMFFDGYGDGKVARLCAERGWLLAAPTGT